MDLCRTWNQEFAKKLISTLPIELVLLILGFMNDPTFIVPLSFGSMILEHHSDLAVEDIFSQEAVLFIEYKGNFMSSSYNIIKEAPEAIVVHDQQDYNTKRNKIHFDEKIRTKEGAIEQMSKFSSLIRHWRYQHEKIQPTAWVWNQLHQNRERTEEYFLKFYSETGPAITNSAHEN